MNTGINPIPKAPTAIVSLTIDALAGLQAQGAAVGIEQNTGARLTLDYHRLVGNPSVAGSPLGKLEEYNASIPLLATARTNSRATDRTGVEFCMEAIGVLKHHLGRQWSQQWAAAGFTVGTLRVPKDPVPMLLNLRSYFGAHPTHQVVPLLITADQANTLVTAIQNGRESVNAARVARSAAKRGRDEAVKALRQRLSGLRAELDQLLEPADERWYVFGFKRPLDGRIPETVTDLVLTEGLPGQVLVEWEPSARAVNYRVTWRTSGPGATTVEAGLFADPSVLLTGLPSGATVFVAVTARNATGETLPVEATIVVP